MSSGFRAATFGSSGLDWSSILKNQKTAKNKMIKNKNLMANNIEDKKSP